MVNSRHGWQLATQTCKGQRDKIKKHRAKKKMKQNQNYCGSLGGSETCFKENPSLPSAGGGDFLLALGASASL